MFPEGDERQNSDCYSSAKKLWRSPDFRKLGLLNNINKLAFRAEARQSHADVSRNRIHRCHSHGALGVELEKRYLWSLAIVIADTESLTLFCVSTRTLCTT